MLVVAVARLLGNLLRALLWPLWVCVRQLALRRVRWVEIRLGTHVVALPRARPWWHARLLRRTSLGGAGETSLDGLRLLLQACASDPAVEGILVRPPAPRRRASARTRSALDSLRGRGKQVVAYCRRAVGTAVYVVSAATRIAPPSGFVPARCQRPLPARARAARASGRCLCDRAIQDRGRIVSCRDMSPAQRRQLRAARHLEQAGGCRRAALDGDRTGSTPCTRELLRASDAIELGLIDSVA